MFASYLQQQSHTTTNDAVLIVVKRAVLDTLSLLKLGGVLLQHTLGLAQGRLIRHLLPL